MTNSSTVPSSYTARWNTGIRQPAREPSGGANLMSPRSASDVSRRKYCSSCNTCRKSRVKCSGGNPCQRCAASQDPACCVYSISQRRGKRKAAGRQLDNSFQQDTSNYLSHASSQFTILPDDWMDSHESLRFSSDESPIHIGTETFDPTFITDELAWLTSEPPSYENFLNAIKPLSPPTSSDSDSQQIGPHSCHMSIQRVSDSMGSKVDEADKTSIDKTLQLFQHTFGLVIEYLSCAQCDNGCPRLLNLALLHQRQANLLGDITKNPTVYLGNAANDTVRVRLGEYQPSRRDDLVLKKQMLLNVARDLDLSVDEFYDRVKAFEDGDISGTAKLSEAGKLNLKWLFDVAASVRKRLECIKSMLGKGDWASHVV